MLNPFGFLPFRKLPTFGPAPIANGISTIQIPVGPTYYAIGLRYKINGTDCTEAQAKSDLKKIRIYIDGVVRYEVSGKRLIDLLNKYYGISFVNGEIFIPLARPWYKTPEAVENTAWGTRNVSSLSLEVEFGSPINTPTLEAHALFTLNSRDLGIIAEVHEFTYNAGVAGEQEVTTLPQGNGDLLALHFDSALVTKVDLEINQQAYINGDTGLYSSIQKWFGLRSPQTGYKHIEGQTRNLLSDGIPLVGVSDFRVKPTFSSAGTAIILMETLNTPKGAANSKANT